ncbi:MULTISPECIES: hypothetical protein [unclassified Streptomyces]
MDDVVRQHPADYLEGGAQFPVVAAQQVQQKRSVGLPAGRRVHASHPA